MHGQIGPFQEANSSNWSDHPRWSSNSPYAKPTSGKTFGDYASNNLGQLQRAELLDLVWDDFCEFIYFRGVLIFTILVVLMKLQIYFAK